MKLEWVFDQKALDEVHALAETMRDSRFVAKRRQRNLSEDRPPVDVARFWKVQACCLLTTQQRSGPNGKIAKLIASAPPFLSFDLVGKAEERRAWLLDQTNGLWRGKIIAEDLGENFDIIQKHWTNSVSPQLVRLSRPSTPAVEREVANFIADKLAGFGPKQSRNLLQALGLTQHEIPVDSRISDWLNKRGFPLPLSSSVLSDSAMYGVIMDGIALLCQRCSLLPCEFDAMVFASYDGDHWTEEALAGTEW